MPETSHRRDGSSSSNTIRNPSALLPSALPKEDVISSIKDEIEVEAETDAQDSTENAIKTFRPLFTIVKDVHDSNQQFHHPKVHYAFSDDDLEVITDASLQAHESFASQTLTMATSAATTRQKMRRSNERFVVVNLGSNGRTVESAYGMTGDWQVLGASISAAPTLEGSEGNGGGMMLSIEGTSGFETERNGEPDAAGLEAMLEIYQERMEELRRIVETRVESGAKIE